MNDNNCPICNEPSEGSCRCPRVDSSCKNGHSWHTCTIHRVKVIGQSDHSTETFSCTCGKEEESDAELSSAILSVKQELVEMDKKEFSNLLDTTVVTEVGQFVEDAQGSRAMIRQLVKPIRSCYGCHHLQDTDNFDGSEYKYRCAITEKEVTGMYGDSNDLRTLSDTLETWFHTCPKWEVTSL